MANYADIPAARCASETTSVVWWILCSATASITCIIHTVTMRLQRHRLTFSQQESIVQQLIVDQMLTIGMDMQIGGFPDLDANLHAIQLDCAAEYSNIAAFIEDLRHFEMTWLAALDNHTRANLLDNIASLIFGIVEGFRECVEVRNILNDGSVYPAPSTHPSDLVKLKGRDTSFVEK